MEPFFNFTTQIANVTTPSPERMKLHGFTPVLVSEVKIGYDTNLQVTNLDVFPLTHLRVFTCCRAKKNTNDKNGLLKS